LLNVPEEGVTRREVAMVFKSMLDALAALFKTPRNDRADAMSYAMARMREGKSVQGKTLHQIWIDDCPNLIEDE